jgi:hypothetical protein
MALRDSDNFLGSLLGDWLKKRCVKTVTITAATAQGVVISI